MTTSLDHLATFLASIPDVPEDARAAAKRTMLDTIGVAAAGSSTTGGQASHAAATDIWGKGPSPVWFSDTQLTPTGAAFVNATYAASLDLDDGHRAAAGHPAAAIVPAVLSIAGNLRCGGHRLLAAVALGYEIGVRVAASRDIERLRTTDTGQWCGYGVAAAAGWLMRLPAPAIANAMAIAGHTSSGQFATGWTRLGHTVKEGIPWSTANGLQAVYLAAAGHTGPIDMLDDERHHDRDRLVSDLGEKWMIERAYFKRYSCCRWAHAAIDAALALKQRLVLSPDEIDEISIETFGRALTLPNQVAPLTSEAAQYSIPFCVAVALVHGERALMPLEDHQLGDPAVIAVASRVRLMASERYSGVFPAATPAIVVIKTRGRVASFEVLEPRGEPGNPLSHTEMRGKFGALTARRQMKQEQSRAIIGAIEEIGEDRAVAPLLDAISSPS